MGYGDNSRGVISSHAEYVNFAKVIVETPKIPNKASITGVCSEIREIKLYFYFEILTIFCWNLKIGFLYIEMQKFVSEMQIILLLTFLHEIKEFVSNI